MSIMYTAELFLHEMGHLFTALVQSSLRGTLKADYKNILTKKNFSMGYGFSDWLRSILPFQKPSKRAGVDVPLTGNERKINQTAGFFISAVVSIGLLMLAIKMGLWKPLMGPLLTSSLTLLFNSWITDIKNPSPDGKIECGDSGVIYVNPDIQDPEIAQQDTKLDPKKLSTEDFFPPFAQQGLTNMRGISSLRGDQGESIMTWGETPEGDVIPIVFKSLKNKRGKPVTVLTHAGFNGELKLALGKDVRPLSGAVREIMTHDRFLTQGTPSLEGLHCVFGPLEKRWIYIYEKGEYKKAYRTVVSVVIENGDNDFHFKHGKLKPTAKMRDFYAQKFRMKKDVYIEPNAEHPKGYYDYLPTGDVQVLALMMQWYNNQGDWTAASRFAVDEIFYASDEESVQNNMSLEEEDALGQFFMDVWEDPQEHHEAVLLRPMYKSKNKTLKDSWVTEPMSHQSGELEFQYERLNRFRDDLKRRLLDEIHKDNREAGSSLVGHLLNRLQILYSDKDLETKIDELVEMTVERFFTADLIEAAAQVDAATDMTGQYAVRVLNSKTPERGVFWTDGQSLALAENFDEGYMVYNSEHTATLVNFADAARLKNLIFLKSDEGGQLTETYFNHETHRLDIHAFSPDKGRFLKEDELHEWRMELTPDNEYYTDPIKRDPNNVGNEEIADIPRAVAENHAKWNDPTSFLRRTADAWVDKLASRYVESYIKTNSRYYGVMRGRMLYAVEERARQLQGVDSSNLEARAIRAKLIRALEHDNRILSYLKAYLDTMVALEADRIALGIKEGRINEDDLFFLLRQIDEGLSLTMNAEIDILSRNVLSNNMDFLNTFEEQQMAIAQAQAEIEEMRTPDKENQQVLSPQVTGQGLFEHESIGSGEAVMFIGGVENSLWIGAENFKEMINIVFPQMPIETDSTNKAIDMTPNDHRKIGGRTQCMVVSLSGATSMSKNLVPVLNEISPNNVFITTGRVDTLMGLSLGQRYYKGAPFSCRIFPTGNYYPSEVNPTAEAELMANQIELVIYMARRMKEMFPHQRPWGMDVSDDNINKLQGWANEMTAKAERLTGIDREGHNKETTEHNIIVENGKIFGNMLTETPLVNLGVRAYTFGIIFLGTPVAALAALIERQTGVMVHSSLWGHVAYALLDTVLALSMPWWISTGFYRSLSKRTQRYARLGPPTVTIGDTPMLHQVGEINASKRGAMAIASMDAHYHGGNPQDHFGARFLHRIRRGAIEIFGLPEDPHDLGNVLLTDNQSNQQTDMAIGWKIWDTLFGKRYKAGPEIFTIGHGEVDPNSSHHHMNIGPMETFMIGRDGQRVMRPDVSPTLSRFYATSFAAFDRLITYNVFFNTAYERATKFDNIGPVRGLVLRKSWAHWRIWNPWESYSKTGVLSTPSPKSSRREQLSTYHDHSTPYSLEEAHSNLPIGSRTSDGDGDAAQTAVLKGGIDMNSNLMNLKISGDATNRQQRMDDHAMITPMIEGVVPKVSGIVTVTPEMLKNILGEGYLN